MTEFAPKQEYVNRWQRCRTLLQTYAPESEGIFVFSRLNIYYFSGSFVNGILWLPIEGNPILLCKRGIERAKIESPITDIFSYNSYRDIEKIFATLEKALPQTPAVEMNGLSWTLSKSLEKYLPVQKFIPGDKCISMTRAKKSPWELEILRSAGAKHDTCLTKLLPPLLHEGMSELDIAHVISDIFFSEGHQGIIRFENYGEEAFLGHIAIGDSANYPSVFNGPVGLRGVHPATPYMGSETIIWSPGKPLIIDNGFTLAGYMTDKTMVYWLGAPESIPAHIQSAHNFCLDLQQEIAAQLKPGAVPSNIWQQCLGRVKDTEWSQGFMALGGNKVHFAGHGIGLAVDEYPVIADGFDLPLEEGMILAVEPKIGLPAVGMVGIENTFEVTHQGGKCLTGEDYRIICI